MSTNWNKRFLDLANHISKWSRDPNRKCGAVIVGQDNREKSMGYNGLPNNCDLDNIDIKKRYEKPLKYMWVEHAERNAIYLGRNGISLDGCKMYVTYFPCCDCYYNPIWNWEEVYSPKPTGNTTSGVNLGKFLNKCLMNVV